MTYRQSNSSFQDGYSRNQSRLNQQIRSDSTDEGCPVIEESGTVCGETNSFNIFQEFRQMYDDCLQKLEGSASGQATLIKLAPFKKLIDDLWEQNAMLVETVEELEQEATYRVTNLQDKLNKSCQKICDYQDDVDALVKVIQNYCECGTLDLSGHDFKTFSSTSVFKNCVSCPEMKKKEDNCIEPEVSYEKTSNSSGITIKCNSTICDEKKGAEMDFKIKSNLTKNTALGSCSNLKEIKHDSFATRHSRANSLSGTSWDKTKSSLKFSSSKSHVSVYGSEYCPAKTYDKNNKYSFDNSDVEFDYQECMRPININLNIGKKNSFDHNDCCCDCSCYAVQPVDCLFMQL